jgi:hypothetical protein
VESVGNRVEWSDPESWDRSPSPSRAFHVKAVRGELCDAFVLADSRPGVWRGKVVRLKRMSSSEIEVRRGRVGQLVRSPRVTIRPSK